MSKPDTWMPFYIGDYLSDTMHLSTEQHGAYLLLLLTAWNRGGHLPSDEAQLALIARCDRKAWIRVRPAVLPFFKSQGGELIQSRLLSEYEKATKVYHVQKANGLKGGRPKKTEAKPDGYPDGKPDSKAKTNPNETPSQPHSQKPKPLASASELDTPGPLESEVCARLEKCGIQDANPNHAKLKALLQAGLSVEEVASIGPEAAKKRKGFAWILATAEGRRRDAEAVDKLPDKPPNGSAAYGPWWETEPATLAYGKALGMPARVGESMPDYRDRLRHAKPQTQRAAG